MEARGIRRLERIAGISWLAVLICLVAQVATEWRMRTPYDPLADAVSDLGMTSCTPQICSPWFALMDGSFVLLGVCLAVGGVLCHRSSPAAWWGSWVATIALIVGGAGMAMVGLCPENVVFRVHVMGAVLGLLGGNFGAAFAGWALLRVRGHQSTGATAIVMGVVGIVGSVLSALVFFGYLPRLVRYGGGLERLGVEPLLLVVALSGGALLLGEDVAVAAVRRLRRLNERRGRG